MAGILLVQGTIQYNYGYSGSNNSFNTSVWNDIYCDSTSKKRIPSNMISRSSICKGQIKRK